MKKEFDPGVRAVVRSNANAELIVGNDHNSTTKPRKHTLQVFEVAKRGYRVSTEGTFNQRRDATSPRQHVEKTAFLFCTGSEAVKQDGEESEAATTFFFFFFVFVNQYHLFFGSY